MSNHFQSSLRTGVIGLGRMGLPMAANLQKAGFPVCGYDVRPEAREAAAALGVAIADSAGSVADQADVVVLSMPTEPVLLAVMTGQGGLAGPGIAGKIMVDTTTTTIKVAEEMAAVVANLGGVYLDAPVTGGVAGAEAGSLTFMVGGDDEGFGRAQPVLAALGSKLVKVGPSGHGQAAKMVNQMLMAAIYVSMGEAFSFASQLGVDVAKVYQAVEEGGAQSRLLRSNKEAILGRLLRENGNLAQHGKDIDYVMNEANLRHLHLPLTSAVHEFYNLSRSLGFGAKASGDMWAVWEKMLGVAFTSSAGSDATSISA